MRRYTTGQQPHARKQTQELGPQWVYMVCAASVRVRACRLRVCVRRMLLHGRGHGGMWVCVSGSENVTCKFLRAWLRHLEDVQHIIDMSSSCRSCSWWFTRSKSWPMVMSSACEEVGE